MSSDSEDDCYGNIAQKLQSMKNKYSEDKIETTNLLIADLKAKSDNSWRKNYSITSDKACDLSQNSETAEEFSLDAIIAKNSKKRTTRTAKRAAVVAVVNNILPEKCSKSKKTKKDNVTTSQMNNITNKIAVDTPTQSEDTSNTNNNGTDPSDPNITNNDSETEGNTASSRRRGRGRGRARQTTPRRGRGRQTTIPDCISSMNSNESCSSASTSRARGRTRQSRRARGRRSYSAQSDELYEPSMYDFMAAIAASLAMSQGYQSPNGPIYSVGNTDEYPDKCDDQPLFNKAAPKPAADVIVIEENEHELDENEELSVKVYWQSSEHVKFNIRRFQKLTQIFDYFAERGNVSKDKLFFTYNDRILKSDDTPDSINYSIVKFIDGGIINQSVSSIFKKDEKEDGIQIKFQCQNVKKPFVTNIRPDDKMLVVMMKCAEHLEKPLEKLKFHFDGDLISGMSKLIIGVGT